MIIPDLNLLLYAVVDTFPHHGAARSWWEAALGGHEEVGLAGPVMFGFLRLITHPRVFDPPMPTESALSLLDEWLARPHVRFLLPGPRHLELAFGLLRDLGAAGNLTTDAQLAALAIEYQAALHSNDTDFGRFSGLRWINPLR